MKGVYLWCLLAISPVALGAGSQVEELLDKRLGQQAVEEAKQEEAALAKRERQAVLVEGQEIMAQADRLIATIENWESTLNALLTNEKGKSISGSQASVDQFIRLQEAERMSLSQAKSIRAGLDTLLEPVSKAKDDDRYTPTDKLRNALKDDTRKIASGVAKYQVLNAQLKALFNQTDGTKSAQTTLGAAIEQRQIKRGEDEIAKQEQEEADKQARELTQHNALEEERRRQDAFDRKQQAQLEKSKREHERLLIEAQNPVLIQRYAPFLAKDSHVLKAQDVPNTRPTVNGYWPRTEGGRPAPLSLTAINGWKALSDVRLFSEIIFVQYNKRPRGDFRKPVSEADWQEMEKRMEEFARYAPLWVELGLLNP